VDFRTRRLRDDQETGKSRDPHHGPRPQRQRPMAETAGANPREERL
jgi:hypothetical protein